MSEDNSEKLKLKRVWIAIDDASHLAVKVYQNGNEIAGQAGAYGQLVKLGIQKAREIGTMPEKRE